MRAQRSGAQGPLAWCLAMKRLCDKSWESSSVSSSSSRVPALPHSRRHSYSRAACQEQQPALSVHLRQWCLVAPVLICQQQQPQQGTRTTAVTQQQQGARTTAFQTPCLQQDSLPGIAASLFLQQDSLPGTTVVSGGSNRRLSSAATGCPYYNSRGQPYLQQLAHKPVINCWACALSCGVKLRLPLLYIAAVEW